MLRQSLPILEQALGARHPELCPSLTLLGSVIARRERPQEGELFLKRSLDLAREILGPNHLYAALALVELARLQALLKNPEATETARQARDALLSSLGPDHPLTKEALPELNRILQDV